MNYFYQFLNKFLPATGKATTTLPLKGTQLDGMSKSVWQKNLPLIPAPNYIALFPSLFSVRTANYYCKRELQLSTTPADFGRMLAAVIRAQEKQQRLLLSGDYMKRWVFGAR